MFFIFNLLDPLFRLSLYRIVFFLLYFNLRKQPPEIFCRKRCLQKLRKFHRKTPVLESLFNKVAGLRAWNFIQNRLQHRKFAKLLRSPFLQNTAGGCLRARHFPWSLITRALKGSNVCMYVFICHRS